MEIENREDYITIYELSTFVGCSYNTACKHAKKYKTIKCFPSKGGRRLIHKDDALKIKQAFEANLYHNLPTSKKNK